MIEHNQGDFTAIVQAGARSTSCSSGGRRAASVLPTSDPGRLRATIGGIAATATRSAARPLRDPARPDPRDDGRVRTGTWRSGGKVIKNVAGYDLGKALRGLVRDSGRSAGRASPRSAAGRDAHDRRPLDDPAGSRRWRRARAGAVEPEALDSVGRRARVRRRPGHGSAAERLAARAEASTAERGRGRVRDEAAAAWAAERDGQRAADGAVVVSSTASRPAEVVEAVRERRLAVGRAAAGVLDHAPGAADERLAARSRRCAVASRRRSAPCSTCPNRCAGASTSGVRLLRRAAADGGDQGAP